MTNMIICGIVALLSAAAGAMLGEWLHSRFFENNDKEL